MDEGRIIVVELVNEQNLPVFDNILALRYVIEERTVILSLKYQVIGALIPLRQAGSGL